jgi:hypothetical protein
VLRLLSKDVGIGVRQGYVWVQLTSLVLAELLLPVCDSDTDSSSLGFRFFLFTVRMTSVYNLSRAEKHIILLTSTLATESGPLSFDGTVNQESKRRSTV